MVKEAVTRKKDAYKVMCQNNTEENKRRYECMTNTAKKADSEGSYKINKLSKLDA